MLRGSHWAQQSGAALCSLRSLRLQVTQFCRRRICPVTLLYVLAKVNSFILLGIDAQLFEVEVDASRVGQHHGRLSSLGGHRRNGIDAQLFEVGS